jgi:molybdenum cofactor biosynthesis protein B
MPKTDRPFIPLRVAVLTVSDTRTRENDTSGDLIEERLKTAGHLIAKREIHRDDRDALQKLFGVWIDDKGIDVIISTGGTGLTRRDITPEALRPHVTKPITGFGEMFRWLSFEEIGTSTIQSRAEAAICDDTVVFLMPGSTGACRLGMDKLILPQLDARHKPCNLTELLPRIRHEEAPH